MDFQKGIATGFAAAIVLVQSWFAIELRDYARMYASFGDVNLPIGTRITTSHAFLYLTPFFGTALIAYLVVWRPAKLWPYLVVAIVLLGLVVATYWYPRAPIYMLAGNIK